MQTKKKSRFSVSAIGTALVVLATRSAAFASSTGISAIDSNAQNITNLIAGMAGIAALALFGFMIWDFVKHRNLITAGFEIVGIVIIGAIGTNASQVGAFFHISGAHL